MNLRLTVLLLTLTTPAYADPTGPAAGEDVYEGRPIPAFVKSIIWNRACDVVLRRPIQNCTPETCTFTDASGMRFEPDSPAWMPFFGYEWAIGGNAINNGLLEGKVLTQVELAAGSHRDALSLVSGLPFDLDTSDELLQVNPAFVRWLGRELLPEADTPMCGRTAKELYAASFQPAVRVALSIHADLKARGLLKKVGVDRMNEIAMRRISQKGPETLACKALGKGSTSDEKWTRIAICWWWLRRGAEGSAESFAAFGREVLTRFDPKGLAMFSRSLPKVEPTKKGSK